MNQRVAFVIPAAPSDSYSRHKLFVSEKRPFIGVAYLISVLRQHSIQVDLFERHLLGANIETTPNWKNYDVACFYSSVAMLQDLWDLLENAKKHVRCIVGGPHATIDPSVFAGLADVIVTGEAETVIAQAISNPNISGVIQAQNVIENLDDLPTAAFDVFAPLPYNWNSGWKSNNKSSPEWLVGQRVWNLNTSRGCPSGCKFCTVPDVWGRSYRAQSAKRIIDDMLRLKLDFKADGIYFREDNFTHDQNRVFTFCENLIKLHNPLPWVCETRVDALQDIELLRIMANAGCKGLYIGAESGSNSILNKIGKGITVEQTITAVANAKSVGIKIAMSTMYGFPFESEGEKRKTDEMVDITKPDWVWKNHYLGVPKSPIYDKLRIDNTFLYEDEIGILHLEPLNLSNNDNKPPGIFLTTSGGDDNHPWFQRFRRELSKNRRVLFKSGELRESERSLIKKDIDTESDLMRNVLSERSEDARRIRYAKIKNSLDAIPRTWPRIQVYTNDVLPPGDQDIILTDIFLDCVSNFAPKYLDKNLWNSSNKLLDALKREKKILTQFRQIWVWSKWMKEWAITHMALSDDKVKVIGIGPTLQPLEKNAPSHDSNPRILFIGNDLYRKGFDLLLGAFSIALEYNKDLQLVAISKNRMPAEFPIEWHTLDPLKFDDERKLSKIIASCTVYVQPSRFEPFGIAYLDAMSHYLPIIGPRAFALKEMITDGITGYYCDLNPESIAANILKILDDKNNLKRMGNSAYKLQQKKYHWPVVIDKINKYLEEN